MISLTIQNLQSSLFYKPVTELKYFAVPYSKPALVTIFVILTFFFKYWPYMIFI